MPIVVPGANRVLTTSREAELASQALASLEGPEGSLGVERAGTTVQRLPRELGLILQSVLQVMAEGGTVTISSLPKELTTSAAAAVLEISRPTLMAMIKEGRIPAHKVGTHTRLRLDDVLKERSARRQRERTAFDELRALEDN